MKKQSTSDLPAASSGSLCPMAWAQNEFGAAPLPDARLRARLVKMAASFMAQPTQSIPQACAGSSQAKAAYRFLANPAVSAPALLQTHLLQTLGRAAEQKVVLAVQDTTSLKYGERAGLGLLGGKKADGLWLHSTMAFTPEGQALGLLGVEHWTRDPKEHGKARQRHSRPQEEKESQRWLNSFLGSVAAAKELPGAQVVSVADREGDVHALFALAKDHPEAGVLVRARHDRKSVEGQTISQKLQEIKPAGRVLLEVPRRGSQPARQAEMEIRFCSVRVAPPRGGKGPELELWVIEAREVGRGAAEPLCWRLITNLPVTDMKAALQMIGWYRTRWQIEEYHRVLKSGCQAQSRQLESAEGLVKVLMLDLVVGWRALELSRLARTEPLAELEEHFAPEEIAVLEALPRQGKPEPRTLRWAVRRIAQLGGFLGRKGDGEPGAMTLWRGLERLSALAEGWKLAQTYG